MEIKHFSKRKNGMSGWIVVLVAVFVFFVVIYYSYKPSERLAIYHNLLEASRNVTFKVEQEGGLSANTEEIIKKNIEEKGLDRNLLTIECSKRVDPTSPSYTPNFGENIKVVLKYKYKMKIKEIGEGLKIEDGEEKIIEIPCTSFITSKN